MLQRAAVSGREHLRVGLGVFLVVGATTALVPTVMWLGVSDELHAILLSLLFSVHLIPFVLWRHEPHFFSPLYLTIIFFMLSFPIRALMYLAFPDDVQGIFPPPVDEKLMTDALIYSIVGIGIYVVGYYHPPRIALEFFRKLPLRKADNRWGIRIFSLYLVGWAVRLYSIETESLATFVTGEGARIESSTVLHYLAQMSTVSYILAWVYFFQVEKRTSSRWSLVLALAVMEGSYQLVIGGSRRMLIELFLYPVMGYYLITKARGVRVSMRRMVVALISISAITVLGIFPYIKSYRSIYIASFGGRMVVDLDLNLEIASKAFLDVVSSTGAGSSEGTWGIVDFLGRQHGFDSLLLVLFYVPATYDYIYGKELLTLPFALIPRALWPDKPIVSAGAYFSNVIVGGDTALGSTGLYSIADGYLNFGFLGIPLIMWLTAILQRVIYSSWCLPHKDNVFATAVYIFLLVDLFAPGFFIFSSLLQRAAILFFVYRYLVGGPAGVLFSRRGR